MPQLGGAVQTSVCREHYNRSAETSDGQAGLSTRPRREVSQTYLIREHPSSHSTLWARRVTHRPRAPAPPRSRTGNATPDTAVALSTAIHP